MARTKNARRAGAAAVAAGAVVALIAGPAVAAHAKPYQDPKVAWVGKNVILAKDGQSAKVTGKYRCLGGRENTHLWVAVKQGDESLTLENTSSDQVALTSFYDTNWNDPGLTVDCDGHWHVSRITVKDNPWTNLGELAKGKALVQWCLFDSTNGGEGDEQGFAPLYRWVTVRGAN
jgi:hypothetical protein